MIIKVGSLNPAKLNAVKDIFLEAEVEGIEVESKVSSQPFSDEETMEGAINRARECAQSQKGVIGIGLEGGVMEIGESYFLCNWGALVDESGNVFTAGGARFPLPREVAEELQMGKELGDIMDAFTQQKGIRKKEGAIGVFTNQLVDRKMMFSHVVSVLKGLYEFSKQKEEATNN
ncbi:inosine/xanthosine triphosphatase [Salirhabdus euzebyi]|uniref:Probable inosine/xanthosine triphosphatase n=1 Tax=Salirhabdus euzebyi TaxID=394506 RepID=A0A841Q237_9BACI|nr:DUF84 family protein [Salirhabdus euzebyi]MBB6452155.1 inosine/xanthosine triphosphatase [Salirhabdus euzebyi]